MAAFFLLSDYRSRIKYREYFTKKNNQINTFPCSLHLLSFPTHVSPHLTSPSPNPIHTPPNHPYNPRHISIYTSIYTNKQTLFPLPLPSRPTVTTPLIPPPPIRSFPTRAPGPTHPPPCNPSSPLGARLALRCAASCMYACTVCKQLM